MNMDRQLRYGNGNQFNLAMEGDGANGKINVFGFESGACCILALLDILDFPAWPGIVYVVNRESGHFIMGDIFYGHEVILAAIVTTLIQSD
jgi:hypothetical protein